MRLPNLLPRVLTAAILILGLFSLAFAESQNPWVVWVFVALALVVIGLASREFVNVCSERDSERDFKKFYYLFTFAPSFCVSLVPLFRDGALTWNLISPIMLVVLIIPIFLMTWQGRIGLEFALNYLPEMYLGSLVVGVGGVSLVALSVLGGHQILFWMIIIVAVTDTFAYFVGSIWGRRKLSVGISPGKTMEGLIGGILAAVIVGYLIRDLFPGVPFTQPVLCIPLISALAQAFDLSKSVIKRKYSVKDTGTLLPGHGGILDRIDGILGASVGVQILIGLMGA